MRLKPITMSQSALEKIKSIEENAAKQIAALKSEAVSEIAKKLSEAKDVVAALQKEYEELTGKTVTGEKAAPGTRKRLSAADKTALVDRCADIIKSADGISMGDIVDKAGESVSAVRDAVSKVPGLRKTGNKASTLYFVG